MARKVWFQLMDAATFELYGSTTAESLRLPEDAEDIEDLRNAVWQEVKHFLPSHVIAANLRVYANEAAHDEENAQPLDPRSSLISLDAQATLIVEVPTQQRSGVANESTGEQWQNLLSMLEWKEPRRLCASPRHAWLYQGAPELVDRLVEPLLQHYDAWQCGNEDKQNHAIHLVLSGPGTGKSRMLDEMKTLLCAAATRSKNPALVDRMMNAYVFRVAFENGTAATGSLLDPNNPDFDVSYRMLYQLAKNRTPWLLFADRLSEMCRSLRLRIEVVIEILAKLEKIGKVENMTVILCVDGLQKLVHDGTKTCDFYRVLTSICSFLNSSTAFAVCVCSATVQMPMRQALADSPQKRMFLIPPPLRGDEVLSARSRIEEHLVEDMGGHGRALEVLQRVLSRYTREQSEQMDPAHFVDEVNQALQTQYGEIFDSPIFEAKNNCKEVLVAILSRRSLECLKQLGAQL